MRKRIKRAALDVLKSAGLFRGVAASRWRRSRLVILCYHGIALEDEHLWDPTLYMSREMFEGRLEALRRGGYRVLPLAEAVARLYSRDLPPKSVAITFDDGGYDFYVQARPALAAFEYPATVYLTTYYCEDNRAVFDPASSYLLWKARGRMVDGASVGLPFSLDLRTAGSRVDAWRKVLAFAAAKQFSADDKDCLLQRLAEAAGTDYGEMRRKRLLHIMNAREVREMAAAGIDFQLHTHRHRTPQDRRLFTRELRDNAARLEALSGASRPSHFCYPCGVNRPEFLPWLAECGVRYATTCEPGLATPESNPLLLPRFVDHGNLSTVEFESCISGFGLLLPNEGQAA